MKITEFKPGDIIHRTKSVAINGFSDRSFMNDGYKLLSIENGIFFLEFMTSYGLEKETTHQSIDLYGDDWDYFPMTSWEKFKNKIKK